MKEAIEKIIEFEQRFQQDLEVLRREREEMITKAKKEATEMENAYKRALEEKKKLDREKVQTEIELYTQQQKKELEKSIERYHKKLTLLRNDLRREIEKRLWEE